MSSCSLQGTDLAFEKWKKGVKYYHLFYKVSDTVSVDKKSQT
jgi:hypothetical protein